MKVLILLQVFEGAAAEPLYSGSTKALLRRYLPCRSSRALLLNRALCCLKLNNKKVTIEKLGEDVTLESFQQCIDDCTKVYIYTCMYMYVHIIYICLCLIYTLYAVSLSLSLSLSRMPSSTPSRSAWTTAQRSYTPSLHKTHTYYMLSLSIYICIYIRCNV